MSAQVPDKTRTISIRTARWWIVLCMLAASPFVYAYLKEERSRNANSRAVSALRNLGMALNWYYSTNDRFPGPTFAEVATALRGPYYANRFTGYIGKQTLSGYDAWEHPLCYEVRSPTEVIVRSFGANGIDEGGGGDDITCRVIPVQGTEVFLHTDTGTER